MSKVRQIVVRQGDDLRAIAARELGDATRWTELAALNDLRMPFIVNTFRPAERLAGTKIWGDTLLIPWETNAARVPSPTSNFGIDIALPHGQLTATTGGDLATVQGRDNIVQALGHRLHTLRGELTYHPAYGSHVSLALGLPSGPFSALMAAAWAQEALVEDPRLARVLAVDGQADGDALRVSASVVAVDDNTPIDFNLVLNP